MVNAYLFAAYTLFWVVFMLYAWNLSRRERRLEKELEALKRVADGQRSPG
jgi:CcmD family protein